MTNPVPVLGYASKVGSFLNGWSCDWLALECPQCWFYSSSTSMRFNANGDGSDPGENVASRSLVVDSEQYEK